MMAGVRSLVVALTALATLAGCGESGPDAGAEYSDTSDYGHDRVRTDFDLGPAEDYESEIELPDGRKVSLVYLTGKGLGEQHYDPESDSWSELTFVYRTEADPCQGISLVTEDGRVAAIADFGGYCYDGEPPMESVAATAGGSFQDWDQHLTPGIDGWTEVGIENADKVTWDSPHYPALTWTSEDGFTGGFQGDG